MIIDPNDILLRSPGSSALGQVLRESLGTVIFMDDRRSRIFLSKTRGLVSYDVNTDEFKKVEKDEPRIIASGKTCGSGIRALFGNCDLVMRLMKEGGLLRILRNLAVNDSPFFSKMVCCTERRRSTARSCRTSSRGSSICRS